jgi:hypothetical protein
MISQFELSSRAALCRQLATQEPANRAVWMAEADSWSRLSEERPYGETGSKLGFTILASFACVIGKMPTKSNHRTAAADLD